MSPWGFETGPWLGQKILKYIPRLGQHPQFYYPVKDKGQNARRLGSKPFIGNCNGQILFIAIAFVYLQYKQSIVQAISCL